MAHNFKRKPPRFGALKTHSEGRIHASDEGDIRFGIASDLAHGVVVLSFGTPVTWLGMPPDVAEALGKTLLEHAAEVRSKGVQ